MMRMCFNDRVGGLVLAALGHALVYVELMIVTTSSASWAEGGPVVRERTTTSYELDLSQERHVRELSTIIDALENLGVLDESHTTCYSLEKLVKVREEVSDRSASSPSQWKIAINFHVRALPTDADLPSDDVAVTEATEAARCLDSFSEDKRDSHSTHNVTEWTGNDVTEATNSTASLATVRNSTSPGLSGVDDGSSVEGSLSIAQIMVISTCSTVIGLFFLVALTMRVRNYIKRKRELRNSRRRYRAADLAGRGTLPDSPSKKGPNEPLKAEAGAKVSHIDRLPPRDRECLMTV